MFSELAWPPLDWDAVCLSGGSGVFHLKSAIRCGYRVKRIPEAEASCNRSSSLSSLGPSLLVPFQAWPAHTQSTARPLDRSADTFGHCVPSSKTEPRTVPEIATESIRTQKSCTDRDVARTLAHTQEYLSILNLTVIN